MIPRPELITLQLTRAEAEDLTRTGHPESGLNALIGGLTRVREFAQQRAA